MFLVSLPGENSLKLEHKDIEISSGLRLLCQQSDECSASLNLKSFVCSVYAPSSYFRQGYCLLKVCVYKELHPRVTVVGCLCEWQTACKQNMLTKAFAVIQ